MSKPQFINSSLDSLLRITSQTHNEQILPIANSIWQKHLHKDNPLWSHVVAKPFFNTNGSNSAHVMALVDKRLPGLGMVGFFGCTNLTSGVKVLQQACDWLKNQNGIANVYGPINGTITRDYRFNLRDDFQVPGEPVNPTWYIQVFQNSGFKVYNRYVSGVSKHYQLFIKFYAVQRISKGNSHIMLRPFNIDGQLGDLKAYHHLMNAIFPHNSIYCPVISWEERLYNLAGKIPVFDPNYTYFLEDNGKEIGFIVALPHHNKLIIKTIGLLPEYRGKHLSGMLLKKVHDQASQDGLEEAIYSTIRVGNSVYHMRRPGVKVFRKYITMNKPL